MSYTITDINFTNRGQGIFDIGAIAAQFVASDGGFSIKVLIVPKLDQPLEPQFGVIAEAADKAARALAELHDLTDNIEIDWTDK